VQSLQEKVLDQQGEIQELRIYKMSQMN